MLSTNLMEYAPQNERITQKSITSSFTPKRKPEDSYMKKIKNKQKYIILSPNIALTFSNSPRNTQKTINPRKLKLRPKKNNELSIRP